MTDKELLKAISQLIDDKLKSINERLDIIELKQNKLSSKLEDIQIDIKLSERNIRRDIHLLKDENETIIEILKMNELTTV